MKDSLEKLRKFREKK